MTRRLLLLRGSPFGVPAALAALFQIACVVRAFWLEIYFKVVGVDTSEFASADRRFGPIGPDTYSIPLIDELTCNAICALVAFCCFAGCIAVTDALGNLL